MKLRYYSHIGLPTGYGNAALEYALALHKAGVELDIRPMNRGAALPARAEALVPLVNRDITPDVVLVHTTPDIVPRLCGAEAQSIGRTPVVAMTTWEAITMPRPMVDELYMSASRIIVPSAASATPLRLHGLVDVVPHTYDAEAMAEAGAGDADPQRRSGEPYTFYFIGAASGRKNIAGLARAFSHCRSMLREDGIPFEHLPRLVIHSTGPGDRTDVIRHVVAAVAATGESLLDGGHVDLSVDPMPEQALWIAHTRGDCFVSASYGEAWNLPAFEAMLFGRHTIVPYNHGTDDYTTGWRCTTTPQPAHNDVRAELADGGIRAVITGPAGLTSSCLWWEPSIHDLAGLMASAVRKGVCTAAQIDLKRYAHESVGPQLRNVLEGVAQ